MCLNTSRQLVVAVDDAAVHWIRNWLVPLAQQSERSLGAKASHAKKDAEFKRDIFCPNFAFSVDPTPNIKDKITWNPEASAWDISVRKPRY